MGLSSPWVSNIESKDASFDGRWRVSGGVSVLPVGEGAVVSFTMGALPVGVLFIANRFPLLSLSVDLGLKMDLCAASSPLTILGRDRLAAGAALCLSGLGLRDSTDATELVSVACSSLI